MEGGVGGGGTGYIGERVSYTHSSTCDHHRRSHIGQRLMLMVRDLGQAVYTSINWRVCACLFVFGNQRKQFLIDDAAVDEGSIRESLLWEQIASYTETYTNMRYTHYPDSIILPKSKES